MESVAKIPALVASTSELYCCCIDESRHREEDLRNVEKQPNSQGSIESVAEDAEESNYFKSAQWTSDGTSLLTSSADNTIRTFILPPNLLCSASPINLMPYTSHTSPTSINCLAISPHFSLQDTSTTLYLSTPTSLPIRLQNCLSTSTTPLSTYNLIAPTTEAYLTPSSLLWSSPGTHFLAGSDCLIARFDVSRSGQGPVTRMPTIPSKRHKLKGGGVGMRGIVSALSHQPSSVGYGEGMLAAGTWTRCIGLYDMGRLGGMVSTWSIADAADTDAGIGGTGVTQTLWSSCGRYLFVVERKSEGVLVYDVRVNGKMVAWLEGRSADTNQRLGVDVFDAEAGEEIWAGGTDGVVRVWEAVGKTEGTLQKSWEWRAHDDPVSSAIVHSSGTAVATCSGQRSISNFEDSDDGSEEGESTIKPINLEKTPSSRIGERGSETHPFNVTDRTPDNSIKVWSL